MNLIFQEMEEKYLGELREIYNYYVSNSTATFQIEEISLSQMHELVFLDSPRYQAYVILADGVLCGYVILTQFKKREAYDETAEVTVYLKPGFTGKAIGQRAVRFIEQAAAERNIHALIACISGENTSSISLFEKLGYEKCGHFKEVGIKFGRRIDVVYYQKIL
jgi:phosphinothricin acetyltransferase